MVAVQLIPWDSWHIIHSVVGSTSCSVLGGWWTTVLFVKLVFADVIRGFYLPYATRRDYAAVGK